MSLPLSLDIPLPYQVVRGEQLQLKGSVYNRLYYNIEVLTEGRHLLKLECGIKVISLSSVISTSTV